MTTNLLSAVEVTTGTNPDISIIWLHGLGADGNDFVPIVSQIKLSASVKFIFPHAPIQPVTINGGYKMRAWYDIHYQDLVFKEDEKGLRNSQQLIEDWIAHERNRGIAPSRIFLAGFSQGGAIALQTGLRYTESLGGILALSTYLPLSSTLQSEANMNNKNIPIFMAHGIQDPIVPLFLALGSRQHLEKLGYQVNWHEYLMPHSVCEDEIEDIEQWLEKILSKI